MAHGAVAAAGIVGPEGLFVEFLCLLHRLAAIPNHRINTSCLLACRRRRVVPPSRITLHPSFHSSLRRDTEDLNYSLGRQGLSLITSFFFFFNIKSILVVLGRHSSPATLVSKRNLEIWSFVINQLPDSRLRFGSYLGRCQS